jgi:hypothetical protein
MTMAEQNDTAPTEVEETAQIVQPDERHAQLEADLARSRFDIAAARAGLDEDLVDVLYAKAAGWLGEKQLEPTRESFDQFLAKQRAAKPKFFTAPVSANTAPTSAASAAKPRTGAAPSRTGTWQSLRSAGRIDEANIFYRANAPAIRRGY